MKMCYKYSIKGDMNSITKRVALSLLVNVNLLIMRTWWLLGDESVDELYEYKSLGVVKTTGAPSLPMFRITLIKQEKRQE